MAKSRAEKSDKKLVSRREFLVGSGAVIAAIALTACASKTTNLTTTTGAITTPNQHQLPLLLPR